MKRITNLAFALLVLVAGSAFAGVNGSPHDLGDETTSLGTTEVCVFCHTPHNSIIDVPLWNRKAPTGAPGWTAYTSTTLDGTMDTATLAASESGMCLSCHDGSIAYGDLHNPPNGATMNTTTKMTSGAAFLGSDLSNDHPVNIVLTPAAGELQNPVGDARLFATRVQCSSCHNPHDNTTNTPFLVGPNADSAICTDCHLK